MIFRKWGGGDQRPFGTFPKIHPFWKRRPSLTLSSEHSEQCAFQCAMLHTALWTEKWALCNVAHCTVNWEANTVNTVTMCTVNREASNADALKCWRTSTKVFTVTFLLLVDHSSFLLLIVIILNTRQSCQLLTTNYVYTFFTGFGVGVGEII